MISLLFRCLILVLQNLDLKRLVQNNINLPTLELSVGILKQYKILYCPSTWTLSSEWKFHGRTKVQHFIKWLLYHCHFQVTYVHQLWHYTFCKDVGSGFVIALLRKKEVLFEKWHMRFQGMLRSNVQNQINLA